MDFSRAGGLLPLRLEFPLSKSDGRRQGKLPGNRCRLAHSKRKFADIR